MIKTIHTIGKYVQVIGGSSSTYVNGQYGAQGVGNLRYNTANQSLEVYDGHAYIRLNMPDASIGLNAEAEQAIDWVRQQMEQQHKLEMLAQKHPSVADATAAVQQAQEQLRIVTALVQE